MLKRPLSDLSGTEDDNVKSKKIRKLNIYNNKKKQKKNYDRLFQSCLYIFVLSSVPHSFVGLKYKLYLMYGHII